MEATFFNRWTVFLRRRNYIKKELKKKFKSKTQFIVLLFLIHLRTDKTEVKLIIKIRNKPYPEINTINYVYRTNKIQ